MGLDLIYTKRQSRLLFIVEFVTINGLEKMKNKKTINPLTEKIFNFTKQILEESKVTDLRDSYLAKGKQQIADMIMQLDGKIPFQGIQWAAKYIDGGGTEPESEIRNVLLSFYDPQMQQKIKARLGGHAADIGKYKYLDQIQEVILKASASKNDTMDLTVEPEIGAEYDLIYEDEDYKVIFPKTKKASIYYGDGTTWCTAYKNVVGGLQNQFYYYSTRNIFLTYFLSKHEKKKTFCIGFMNGPIFDGQRGGTTVWADNNAFLQKDYHLFDISKKLPLNKIVEFYSTTYSNENPVKQLFDNPTKEFLNDILIGDLLLIKDLIDNKKQSALQEIDTYSFVHFKEYTLANLEIFNFLIRKKYGIYLLSRITNLFKTIHFKFPNSDLFRECILYPLSPIINASERYKVCFSEKESIMPLEYRISFVLIDNFIHAKNKYDEIVFSFDFSTGRFSSQITDELVFQYRRNISSFIMLKDLNNPFKSQKKSYLPIMIKQDTRIGWYHEFPEYTLEYTFKKMTGIEGYSPLTYINCFIDDKGVMTMNGSSEEKEYIQNYSGSILLETFHEIEEKKFLDFKNKFKQFFKEEKVEEAFDNLSKFRIFVTTNEYRSSPYVNYILYDKLYLKIESTIYNETYNEIESENQSRFIKTKDVEGNYYNFFSFRKRLVDFNLKLPFNVACDDYEQIYLLFYLFERHPDSCMHFYTDDISVDKSLSEQIFKQTQKLLEESKTTDLRDSYIAKGKQQIADMIMQMDGKVPFTGIQWASKYVDRGGPEPANEIIGALSSFYNTNVQQKIKAKLGPQKLDINGYKSLNDVQQAIIEATTTEADRQMSVEPELGKEYDLIYEDEDYKVVFPKTKRASVYFGDGTTWCTAYKNVVGGLQNQFYYYSSKGTFLTYFLSKHDKEKTFCISFINGSPYFDGQPGGVTVWANNDGFLEEHYEKFDISNKLPLEKISEFYTSVYSNEHPIKKQFDNPSKEFLYDILKGDLMIIKDLVEREDWHYNDTHFYTFTYMANYFNSNVLDQETFLFIIRKQFGFLLLLLMNSDRKITQLTFDINNFKIFKEIFLEQDFHFNKLTKQLSIRVLFDGTGDKNLVEIKNNIILIKKLDYKNPEKKAEDMPTICYYDYLNGRFGSDTTNDLTFLIRNQDNYSRSKMFILKDINNINKKQDFKSLIEKLYLNQLVSLNLKLKEKIQNIIQTYAITYFLEKFDFYIKKNNKYISGDIFFLKEDNQINFYLELKEDDLGKLDSLFLSFTPLPGLDIVQKRFAKFFTNLVASECYDFFYHEEVSFFDKEDKFFLFYNKKKDWYELENLNFQKQKDFDFIINSNKSSAVLYKNNEQNYYSNIFCIKSESKDMEQKNLSLPIQIQEDNYLEILNLLNSFHINDYRITRHSRPNGLRLFENKQYKQLKNQKRSQLIFEIVQKELNKNVIK